MTRIRHYRLDGKEPVACTLLEWAAWFGSDARTDRNHIIAITDVADGVRVSTVFLGIDHNFSGKGAPLIFESMVFDDYGAGDCRRYSTWAEAEEGHLQLVDELQAKLGVDARMGEGRGPPE